MLGCVRVTHLTTSVLAKTTRVCGPWSCSSGPNGEGWARVGELQRSHIPEALDYRFR